MSAMYENTTRIVVVELEIKSGCYYGKSLDILQNIK